MIPTSGTRFCAGSPLSDLFEKTLMLLTLVSQNLNKLVETKVADFASPKPFHTLKVQGLKHDHIKLLTEFRRKLPMKVLALVADFPIQTGELSHTPPPSLRTFLLARKCFIQRPKRVQVRFQGLWVLDFLTRAECQISVFHAEVCPNALTCCWQRFEVCIGRYYTKPIVSTTLTFDCDTPESAMPLAVLVKCISHFIKPPFTLIPLAKCKYDTVVSKVIPSLFKSDRLKLMARFDMGFTPQFIKEPLIRIINAFQLCLDRLAWQRLPMWVCAAFQIFCVLTHCSKVGIRKTIFVSLVLPLMEVGMHLPHIVKQIANADCIRLVVYLIFIGFHGLSSIKFLTPNEWGGRHVVSLRLRLSCLPT